jgi:hypothetical protein
MLGEPTVGKPANLQLFEQAVYIVNLYLPLVAASQQPCLFMAGLWLDNGAM